MTRVWSMASQSSHTQDCSQLEEAIIMVCTGAAHQPSAAPPPQTIATPLLSQPLTQPLSLPPDTDSGYEASPSSATRLATFQFGSLPESSTIDQTVDTTIDEDLLSIDLIFAPIMLYDDNQDSDDQSIDDEESDEEELDDDDYGMRDESRNSGAGSSGSSSSDRLISTPIPIPIPMTSRNSSLTQTSSHLRERSTMSSPLSLSYTNVTSMASNSNGFGGEMFVRHHRHRYHMAIDAISPQSPPSSSAYWSPYLMDMSSPIGRHGYHHNNHYLNLDESMNSSQDIRLSSVPSIGSSVFSSGSEISSRRETSDSNAMTDANDGNANQPLPDVVNVEVRVRSSVRNPARRAVSVSLPIDAETIRSVGMSLRRISEEFEISTSGTMLSNRETGRYGLVGNVLASLRLSRRSLSSRFRSQSMRHNGLNGRPRSFSTNDATEQ